MTNLGEIDIYCKSANVGVDKRLFRAKVKNYHSER